MTGFGNRNCYEPSVWPQVVALRPGVGVPGAQARLGRRPPFLDDGCHPWAQGASVAAVRWWKLSAPVTTMWRSGFVSANAGSDRSSCVTTYAFRICSPASPVSMSGSPSSSTIGGLAVRGGQQPATGRQGKVGPPSSRPWFWRRPRRPAGMGADVQLTVGSPARSSAPTAAQRTSHVADTSGAMTG